LVKNEFRAFYIEISTSSTSIQLNFLTAMVLPIIQANIVTRDFACLHPDLILREYSFSGEGE